MAPLVGRPPAGAVIGTATAPVRIVPLGGLGQIGRNLLAVEVGDDIVVIDAGLMFPEQSMLGIDLVIPDITWLLERRERVRGIVLTHAHEDHIGALPYVLPRLPVPVYGTELTLGFLRGRLREHRLLDSTALHTVAPGETVTLGALPVEFVHTTHSVPDACAVALHTPLGVVLHTGDFKIDHTPVTGEPPDLARFARLGDAGVLLLLSDSTNVEQEGMTPSERSVGEGLEAVVAAAAGRVVLATFASNISRLQQAMDCAHAHGRRTLVVGRSMMTNVQTALELGRLRIAPGHLLWPRQLDRVPDSELLVTCTGSQGEPLSALARIASGDHPLLSVHEGDTVILSANPIPGNEELVHRTINQLYRRGATVVAGSRHHVHASGHASREELKLMLALTRPRYFVPVHGEYRHLAMHADLARGVGVPAERVQCVDNGTVLEVDADAIRRVDRRAPSGYVYVDGLAIEEGGDVVLRDRRHLAQDGVVVVVLAVEASTGAVVAGPDLVVRGVSDDVEAALDEARAEAERAVAGLPGDAGVAAWKEAVHDSLARLLHRRTNRRPMILPVVTEV